MTVQLDPGLDWHDRRLAELLDWWSGMQRQLGCLPARQDFDPLLMPGLLPHVYMVDVIDGGARYRWRLLGTELNVMAGRNATGAWFDELYDPAIYDNVVASLHSVVRRRQPMRSFGSYSFAARAFVHFEAMEVPLSEDGDGVDIVLGIAVNETAEDPAQ